LKTKLKRSVPKRAILPKRNNLGVFGNSVGLKIVLFFFTAEKKISSSSSTYSQVCSWALFWKRTMKKTLSIDDEMIKLDEPEFTNRFFQSEIHSFLQHSERGDMCEI